METFTLVVWFMVGSEMQVERTKGLTQTECIAKLEEVLASGRRSATCRAACYDPPILYRGHIL
jgi:hypothetical protein